MKFQYFFKYLGKQILASLIIFSSFAFAQTYPDLEMGNVTPSVGTATNVSVALQKDTNNNTATSLVNYASPSALTVSFNVNLNTFTNAVRFGTGGIAPFYSLMNSIGNAGNDNTQYTSNGVPANGTGIDITQNYATRVEADLATAGNQAGNGRVKLGEITIALSRGVNNPHLHFKGLGGTSSGSLTAEFTVISVLNSSGTQILTGTAISQLSGTNLNVNNTAKTINNDYTGPTDAAAINSARGTVRFQNNDIRTIVLEVYGNRNGADATVAPWVGLDAFLIGLSAAESDLQVTKTVNQTFSAPGSTRVFTVTATNNGASNNTNVTVTDLLPSGYTFVSSNASVGTYNSATGLWTIGNLNDGANAVLTLTTTVNPTGNYSNTAVINTTSGINDPETANNSATAAIILDTDSDGIPDNLDLDDDNDGVVDCVENNLAAASFLNNFTFVANNNASGVSANIAQLTPNTGTQSGQYWSVGKVDFTKSFSFGFDAFVGEFDAGADGIAVVFQNSPLGTAAVGATGVGMGAQNIANGLVLELDTYDNGLGVGDITADHGQIWDSDNQGTGLTTAVALGQLENNAYHPVVVTWNAATQTLSYTVDGITAGTLTTANFATTYFGASKVRFGFTASTGGSTNVHRIRINDFCSTPIELDTDNDGISNHLDTDSDGDSCPDAIEGSENVTYTMVNPLTATTNPGQIRVLGNGTTAGTPAQVISTVPAANGVPLLVNNAANNTGGVAGVADNTGASPVAGVGQAVGNSQNSALNDCKCYRNPTTTLGTDNATIHGITAFNRAGADNTNWPMIRNNGWTALEANTKAFVMNRMPVAATTAGAVIAGEPVNAALTSPVIAVPIVGMTFYDTTNNCMKINTDGTRTGWKCFNTQSCPEEN